MSFVIYSALHERLSCGLLRGSFAGIQVACRLWKVQISIRSFSVWLITDCKMDFFAVEFPCTCSSNAPNNLRVITFESLLHTIRLLSCLHSHWYWIKWLLFSEHDQSLSLVYYCVLLINLLCFVFVCETLFWLTDYFFNAPTLDRANSESVPMFLFICI